jgi:predicted small lipoprotein YifL
VLALALAISLPISLAGCGVKAPPRPAASAGVEGAPAGSGK